MAAPYQPFSVMAQSEIDYDLPVICTEAALYGKMLTICTPDAAIYVTREQAKEFFGLAEKPNDPQAPGQ